MKIGERVIVPVNGERGSIGQVIDIKGEYVVVAGEEEMRRAAQDNRSPIGLAFNRFRLKRIQ